MRLLASCKYKHMDSGFFHVFQSDLNSTIVAIVEGAQDFYHIEMRLSASYKYIHVDSVSFRVFQYDLDPDGAGLPTSSRARRAAKLCERGEGWVVFAWHVLRLDWLGGWMLASCVNCQFVALFVWLEKN